MGTKNDRFRGNINSKQEVSTSVNKDTTVNPTSNKDTTVNPTSNKDTTVNLRPRKKPKPKIVKDTSRGFRCYSFKMTYSPEEAEIIDSLRIRYKLSTSGMFRLLLHAIYNSELDTIPNKF